MNNTVLQLKEMKRAMKPFVLLLYEIILEGNMQNVLEIGVNAGQSTRTILSALKEKNSGKLVSIDIKNRSHRIPDDLAKYWKHIVGDSTSRDTIFKMPNIDENHGEYAYDLLLIDGDHSYEGVKKDYELYERFVKKGGFILFHDVKNNRCGVPQFWDELNVKNKITLPFGVAGMGIFQK